MVGLHIPKIAHPEPRVNGRRFITRRLWKVWQLAMSATEYRNGTGDRNIVNAKKAGDKSFKDPIRRIRARYHWVPLSFRSLDAEVEKP